MNDKPQILVVEDDPVAMAVMVASLKHVFDVTTATQPTDAIQLLQARSFACVVTDWFMGGGDGGAVISAVREMPDETRPAIFVVTAGRVGDIGPQARALGAIGAMQKPCSPQILVAMLAQSLARRETPKRMAEPKRPSEAPKRATAKLPAPPQGRQTTALRRAPAMSKPRLLLVESDAAAASVLRGFLSNRYAIEIAPTLAEAKDALAKQRFEIVVSDWTNSTQTAAALLSEAQGQEGGAVPVIIQSWDKSEAAERAALDAGAAAYLRKPLSLTQLGLAIEKTLAERKHAVQVA